MAVTLSAEQIASLLQSIQDQSTNIAALAKTVNVKSARENPVAIQFATYDGSVESFSDYTERLGQYFIAQNVEDGSKVPMFVSLLSPEMHRLLKHLCYPTKVEKKTYTELTTLLTNHLCPKQLEIPARVTFLNRKQSESERVNLYVAELRKLALPCNYPEDMLKIMLRDVFVSGLRSKDMMNRLFTEKDLTFERAVEIATSMEASAKNTAAIGNYVVDKSVSEPGVKKLSKKNKPKPQCKKEPEKKSDNTPITCFKCAKPGHRSNVCKATDLECSFCKSDQHVVEVCSKKKKHDKNKAKKLKAVRAVSPEPSEKSIFPIEVVRVANKAAESPIFVSICVNDRNVKFEYDTGAAKTVVTESVALKLPSIKLLKTDVKFEDYSSKIVKPIGMAFVTVRYRNSQEKLELYVVSDEYSCVVGRNWIVPLSIGKLPPNDDVSEIHSLSKTKSTFPELDQLISEFSDIFSEDIGPVKKVVSINLKVDAKPIFQRARVVPLALSEPVNREIDRLVKSGCWVPVDYSDWASPIVPVLKGNGDVRLCGDYSGTLNGQIHVTQHPFPGIEQAFANIQGDEFSTVDVRCAFHHMLLTLASSSLMVLNTQRGLFRPTRMEFGIASAPAEWQKFIDEVFARLKIVFVHDDGIVTGKTRKEHLENLRKVFETCRENGIKLNLDKCKFFQSQVNFLGYIIDKNGVSKTPEKIQAVLETPRPRTVTEVKSFTGLVNFYGKFFKQLATMAHPLYQATQGKSGKEVIEWTNECEKAFQAIKKEIASPTILVHYSPSLPLVLAVDASPVGIGAVLSHQIGTTERPIAFASRILTESEKNYSQLDKEALAIKWGVEKFFYYLYGRHFTLITDHQPLVHIFSKKKKLPVLSATRRLHYAVFLQMFDFDIKYRKSEDHGNADFLSRFPQNIREAAELFNTSADRINRLIIQESPITERKLASETVNDPELVQLMEKLRTGDTSDDYTLHGNIIMRGIRIVIPTKLRNAVLSELHKGHFGASKMKALARSTVYWPKIDDDIENLTRSCASCIPFRKEQNVAKVHFWEYPTAPWERIHLDFAGPFQEKLFLLVVDAHSKWLEVKIVPNTSSKVVIDFLQQLFSQYGFPKVLVSDNGTAFTSGEFADYLNMYDIMHKTCAPFHAASNGQAERYVYTLKQSLRAIKQDEPGSTIQDRLYKFLFAYRRAPNTTTGQPPAQLFLNRQIRSLLDVFRPDLKTKVEKNRADFEFRDVNYVIGEKVALRNYSSANKKWEIGTIINKDGVLHYTVQLGDKLIRRHSNQLRKVDDSVAVTASDSTLSYVPPASANEEISASPATNHSESSLPKPASGQYSIPDPVPLRRSNRERKQPDRLTYSS